MILHERKLIKQLACRPYDRFERDQHRFGSQQPTRT